MRDSKGRALSLFCCYLVEKYTYVWVVLGPHLIAFADSHLKINKILNLLLNNLGAASINWNPVVRIHHLKSDFT